MRRPGPGLCECHSPVTSRTKCKKHFKGVSESGSPWWLGLGSLQGLKKGEAGLGWQGGGGGQDPASLRLSSSVLGTKTHPEAESGFYHKTVPRFEEEWKVRFPFWLEDNFMDQGKWEDGRWRVLLCHHPHGHLMPSAPGL